VRLYWDLTGSHGLFGADYRFAENPLLVFEAVLLVPATIIVATAMLIVEKRWVMFGGLIVCLCTLADDIYYLSLGIPTTGDMIASNILWFGASAAGLCFFGYALLRRP
jgi:hypothetical protein